jgi:glutamyl-tRNA synthetase
VSGALVRGRYAPSPTGTLHLGNLRTALLAWLFARSAGGRFVLRMEDLDQARVRPGAAEQQLADLRWLGVEWDEGPHIGGAFGPYVQSARMHIYDAELARLRTRELIYSCYCTRAELSRVASAPQGDDAPRYPGTCRDLSSRARRRLEASGRRPALRFHAPDMMYSFRDHVAGLVEENVATSVGDFVVRRSDGIVAYQLAVVVDDALMGITQVARGADLLPSTPRQLALYDALGYAAPREFAHVSLALDEGGVRMAKRDASRGVATLRAAGVRPERVLGALAASCGLWPIGTPATLADLLSAFNPATLDPLPSVIQL